MNRINTHKFFSPSISILLLFFSLTHLVAPAGDNGGGSARPAQLKTH